MQKRTYYIPTVEVLNVNTVLMQSGIAQISGKGGYGGLPPRRDPAF